MLRGVSGGTRVGEGSRTLRGRTSRTSRCATTGARRGADPRRPCCWHGPRPRTAGSRTGACTTRWSRPWRRTPRQGSRASQRGTALDASEYSDMLSTPIPTWKAPAEDEAKRAYTEQQVGDTSLTMHGFAHSRRSCARRAAQPSGTRQGCSSERSAQTFCQRERTVDELDEREGEERGRLGCSRRTRTWSNPDQAGSTNRSRALSIPLRCSIRMPHFCIS
jgi:hypothetical protein